MELTRVGPTQSLFLTLRFMTGRSQKIKITRETGTRKSKQRTPTLHEAQIEHIDLIKIVSLQ
jgi:hypothetical protein